MHDERDSRVTPVRIALRELYTNRGIIPMRRGFGCSSLARCTDRGLRRLHTGNWATVGTEYGLAPVDGLNAAIMFVAMDRGGYGGADEETFEDAQREGRSHIERPANAHMGGVQLILKQLVDERDPRRLSGMCALTNAIKCVQPTNSMSTKPTPTMIAECGNHVVAEIGSLRPDIVITQGGHPADTLITKIPTLQLLSPRFVGDGRSAAVFANSQLLVVTTPHPARQKGLKWTKGELPQFYIEALQRARIELIKRLNT
jgi:uracil-DNA glycosylase family 4